MDQAESEYVSLVEGNQVHAIQGRPIPNDEAGLTGMLVAELPYAAAPEPVPTERETFGDAGRGEPTAPPHEPRELRDSHRVANAEKGTSSVDEATVTTAVDGPMPGPEALDDRRGRRIKIEDLVTRLAPNGSTEAASDQLTHRRALWMALRVPPPTLTHVDA